MADDFNENWDPMQEDYYDDTVNSYDTGPGSRLPRHQQPANFRKGESQPTKLYLYPLTDGYTKESLNNIFSQFGEIIEIYIDNKSHKWAFVTMKTAAAAERALRELSGHTQFDFKLQYAREKLDSASVAANEIGSAETSHRKSEDITQIGQFVESYSRKSINDCSSMMERNILENLERPSLNGSYQKPAIVNGDLAYQAVPNCLYCKRQTVETCMRCFQSFCSRDCMIRGYDGHTDQCILVPPHSSQLKSQAKMPPTNGQPFIDYPPTICEDFTDTSRNYMNHYRQSTINVSNSRKSENINNLSAKNEENNSQDIHDKRPAGVSNSRKFEIREPAINESPKKKDNFQMNDTHRMKDNVLGRGPSSQSNTCTEEEDSFIKFNISRGGKKNHHVRKERDSRLNRSENESSKDNQTSVSGHRSNQENVSSWDNQSQVSGYRSNMKNESSRDNQTRASGYRPNQENVSSWDNQSPVSGYRSNKENESSRNNQTRASGHRSNQENVSSSDKQSQVSKNRSTKENVSSSDNQSQVSKYRSNKMNVSSPGLGHSRNRSYNDTRMSDDEMVSKRRFNRDNQNDFKPKTFENNRNIDAFPRSQKSEFNTRSTHPKKPELSPPFRVHIKENVKFQVKLAENGPPAVMIMQEADSLNSMIDTLQEFNLKPVEKFYKGLKCVAKKTLDDYGTWYRCSIHEVDPLRVKFIDFNYEPVQVRKEDLRNLPEEFTSILPFCYPVNFLNASIDELGELKNSTFEIVFLSKKNELWNVNLVIKTFKEEFNEVRSSRDARKQSDSSRMPQNSYSDLKINLKKDVPVEVYVTYMEASSKKIFVTMQDKLSKLMKLIANTSPPSLPELKEIRINTMCLALYYNEWYRARIVSVNPLEVYYIDFGNTEPAKKCDLRMVPDELFRIDPLVVVVKFRNGSKSSVNFEETVEIIPIEEEMTGEKIWVVRLASEPEILEKLCPVQGPLNEESGEESVALNSILKVQVTYTVSNTEYYVGPENMNKLLEMGITDAEVLKMGLLKTLSLGALCLRIYDEVWCRAKIVKLEPLTIYYIDFGNEEEVDVNDLYPLPEKFQTVRPLAFKIHLREPKVLAEYVPLKIKKVSEKFWTVIDESSSEPQINSNMEVLILAAEENTYGVIPSALHSTFKGIQKALLKVELDLPVEKPEVNLICVERANVSARVRVIETDPLVLHYLDFGYEEVKDTYCNLRMIPQNLALLDPVAFKISVKNSECELLEGQKINIKILDKILEGHYFVEVFTLLDCSKDTKSLYESASECNTSFSDTINSPTPNNNADTFTIKEEIDRVIVPLSLPVEKTVRNDDLCSEIGSVATGLTAIGDEFLTRYPNLPKKYFLNEISANTTFVLTVMKCLNNSRYTGMLMQKVSPHRAFLRQYLSTITADPDYRPQVGDVIAALLHDTEIWSRAIVLSQPTNLKTKYRVAMIDIGCAYDVEKIAPLKNNFHNFSNLSVYCEIKKFPATKKPLKLFQIYRCEISEKIEDGTIVGRVWNSGKPEQEYQVSFKPWIPSIDELGVSQMPISNNSRVKITAYNTSNTCHISLCDDKNFNIGLNIMEDVADYCFQAEPMTEEPFTLEIVGVEYEDTFWRGKVLEKQGDSYSVLLLDRGIECILPLKCMRSLPEYLKLPYSIAVPVTLKNVPITDIYPKVSSYMKSLIKQEKYFDVLIDEGTKEIELKFLNDESYKKDNVNSKTLNEYLVDVFTPTWKKKVKSSSLGFDDVFSDFKFFIEDMRFDELVVGSKMSLYLADKSTSHKSFIVVNKQGKNYKKFSEVNLYERLADYATTVTDPYVPTSGELCIAQHEDVWYRGLCLNSQPNSKIVVQLIDDGPVVPVWHTNIRKIIPEFSYYKATALLCIAKDKQQFDEKKVEKLINSEIRVKILEKKGPDEYIIDCCKIFQ